MSSPSSSSSSGLLRYVFALGPALIVASVVLGPGSILTSSQVGAGYGYSMIWVLVLAAALMAGMTAVGAAIGVSLNRSPGDELAARLGRPVAVLVGLSVFLICGCFQVGNNLGVLAAIHLLMREFKWTGNGSQLIEIIMLLALNGVIVAALYGMKHLYKPLEKIMMLLVGLMLIGFATNLIMAQPDLNAIARGLIPRLPAASGNDSQAWLKDALLPVLGLAATTFSVAGAYYQAYLVREKGWNSAQLKQGLVDSFAGITVLGGISLMIMVTSAAVLHGNPEVTKLGSVEEVAYQLKPMFGNWAIILFCLGFFAGAFSSFLMNAMIGGGLMADGLGLGGSMDSRYSKLFTVITLLATMLIASTLVMFERDDLGLLITLGQAITVIALPPLAAAMLYLLHGCTREYSLSRIILLMVGYLGLLAAFVLAVRTGYLVYGKVMGS